MQLTVPVGFELPLTATDTVVVGVVPCVTCIEGVETVVVVGVTASIWKFVVGAELAV